MSSDDELRKQALKRIKRKRDFRRQLFTYVVINAFLIAIWYISDRGFFWPGFVIAGWGIGLLFSAWNAYCSKPINDAEVEQEMQRLKGQS